MRIGLRSRRIGVVVTAVAGMALLAGCAGDRLEVTDPLETLDSAELVTADREDELPTADEFVDGIFTYGDRRWFFRFEAGATCEGDEILFSVRSGEADDELVAEVRSTDAGDCDDAADFRTVVIVLAEPFADARFVELDVVTGD